MPSHEPALSATTDGVTVSPALDILAESEQIPQQHGLVDLRVLGLCGWSILIGLLGAVAARVLIGLITLITNIAFFQQFSFAESIPGDAVGHLGWWVIPIPIIGALIVGFMARYGSQAIRGHGIPEAMEQILTNQSRIPARITVLKPISAAIAIGTGGPFGAEGPIIATGGAAGSVIGQMLHCTITERKTLLAAGAAAGMAATFGSPVSAVLLAMELLLFEFRPRSIIPVALASVTAAGVRMSMVGAEPIFGMPNLEHPTFTALCCYIAMGAIVGLIAAAVTKALYVIEDGFDHLPIHWMWWPAIGAVAVGIVGWLAPNTLGVGYYNIRNILSLSDGLTIGAIAWLCTMKFVSWSISLGSGTSGGTLAPLMTIGAGIGAVLGAGLIWLAPASGVDIHIAALVGMAALFAGASRALLASVVFAFETTLQPLGLLPILGGCSAAYLVSILLTRYSIMTEKIERRGVRAPAEYVADLLSQVLVRDVTSKGVVSLRATDTVGQIREWLATNAKGTTHQGFPVLDERQTLVGVLTRRNLLDPAVSANQPLSKLIQRLPKFVYEDCTVRQAADHMVNHGIGRLPVVRRGTPPQVIGMVTRSDVLSVFQHGIRESAPQPPTISVRIPRFNGRWAKPRTPKAS
jgi:H+/Cl- antiporter ClcA/predicted transcriptional regulator